MKSRPILFSGPMVRAILEGRKTQTRRVVKPQPNAGWKFNCFDSFYYWWTPDGTCNLNGPHEGRKCPFGQPGDRLWVRETWAAWDSVSDREASEVDGTAQELAERGLNQAHISYRADPRMHADKWRPSIHMPRWASRITLEIESVRVERVQEISENDARAEGCDGDCPIAYIPPYTTRPRVYHYAHLWQSINGPGSWDANPWVWVIQFRRVQK